MAQNLNLDLKVGKEELLDVLNSVGASATKVDNFVKENLQVRAVNFDESSSVLDFFTRFQKAKELFAESLTFLNKEDFNSIYFKLGTIDITITVKGDAEKEA